MIATVPTNATREGLEKIARLRALETKIETHLSAISLGFYEIGLAFKTIRDEELYKEQYLSFQAFCEANSSKYRICYQVIRQYVTASEVIDILQDSGFDGKKLPQNASLCRPLAKLRKVKDKMARVWGLALADTDDSPTASVVSFIGYQARRKLSVPRGRCSQNNRCPWEKRFMGNRDGCRD